MYLRKKNFEQFLFHNSFKLYIRRGIYTRIFTHNTLDKENEMNNTLLLIDEIRIISNIHRMTSTLIYMFELQITYLLLDVV